MWYSDDMNNEKRLGSLGGLIEVGESGAGIYLTKSIETLPFEQFSRLKECAEIFRHWYTTSAITSGNEHREQRQPRAMVAVEFPSDQSSYRQATTVEQYLQALQDGQPFPSTDFMADETGDLDENQPSLFALGDKTIW